MPGYQHLSVLLVIAGATRLCAAADVNEIVQRASTVLQKDWNAAPGFAFLQKDEFQQAGKPDSSGRHDFRLGLRLAELKKLQNEIGRRRAEDAATTDQRTREYRRARDQNGNLIMAFPGAFFFELKGEQEINGRPAWLLSATPRKAPESPSRERKVRHMMIGLARK